MSECLFCNIVAGKIPAKLSYQDESVIAFSDINPKAPLHALVVPRKHIATLNDLSVEDASLMGQLYLAAKQIASEAGFAERGYRTVMNCNAEAGQSVYHIHLHVLGGRSMGWPPG